jgi:hypothetical protein
VNNDQANKDTIEGNLNNQNTGGDEEGGMALE